MEKIGLWEIQYRDEGDLGCPVFRQRVHAASEEHAREVFLDCPDADGWEILKVTKLEDN